MRIKNRTKPFLLSNMHMLDGLQRLRMRRRVMLELMLLEKAIPFVIKTKSAPAVNKITPKTDQTPANVFDPEPLRMQGVEVQVFE